MNKQGRGKIEYLDMTWAPVTGCLHPCKDTYCYARKITHRFSGADIDHLDDGSWERTDEGLYVISEPLTRYIPQCGKRIKAPYPFGFAPTFHRYRLDEPQKVKKPSIIGVVYMGDLFGDWVPDEWIMQVIEACRKAPQHTYVFLTKNPKRYRQVDIYRGLSGIKSFIGTTITSAKDVDNYIALPWGTDFYGNMPRNFISIEPLLGEIDLSRRLMTLGWMPTFDNPDNRNGEQPSEPTNEYINWVIIGQQTGPGAVPPKDEWVQSIIDQCRAAGAPVFVKNPLWQKYQIQEYPEGLK